MSQEYLRRIRGGLVRALVVMLALVILQAAHATFAHAVPPGGPSPDTPGTYAEVSPKELRPGATIQFAVSGYPAGETLNIKIDDGSGYSDTTTAGSGVVHTQAIGASGSTSGSLRLPSDISEGWHWLRFLASEVVEGKGVLGYTNGAGSASNTSHPTAFYVAGESLGGATAAESVVPGTSPGEVAATPGNTSSTSSGGTAGGSTSGGTTSSGTTTSDGTTADGGATGAASGGETYAGSGDIVATMDAPLEDFVRLTLGGIEVASKDYTLASGSTVITLKEAYLKTLAPGAYVFKAEFSGISAGTGASVVDIPLTIPAASATMTDEEAAAAADGALLTGAAAPTSASSAAGGAAAALPLPGLIALGAVLVAGVAVLLVLLLRRPRPLPAAADALGDGHTFGGGFGDGFDAGLDVVEPVGAAATSVAPVAEVTAEAVPAPGAEAPVAAAPAPDAAAPVASA